MHWEREKESLWQSRDTASRLVLTGIVNCQEVCYGLHNRVTFNILTPELPRIAHSSFDQYLHRISNLLPMCAIIRSPVKRALIGPPYMHVVNRLSTLRVATCIRCVYSSVVNTPLISQSSERRVKKKLQGRPTLHKCYGSTRPAVYLPIRRASPPVIIIIIIIINAKIKVTLSQ